MVAKREVIHSSARTSGSSRNEMTPVSSVVRGGDFLFLAGLVAVDLQSNELMRGTTASETRLILANLKTLVEAAGSSLDKIVKINVVLHSMLEAPNMNEVYAGFFSDPPPARTVCGAVLPHGMKVMIDCTALT